FASKHANKSGQAEFTVHALANWGKAEFGGKDKNVCKSSGVLMRNYFEGLEKFRKEFGLEEYRVALEADHHGPWVSEKPVVFIEFGGSEKQWADKNAARVLVETILSCTKLENLQNWIPAIGLGGTHYCDNFVKVLQRSNYCFSHICPKYGLPEFDENSLQQCLEKSAEKIQAIVLDAKGLADKERIKKIVAETGLQIVKTEQLTK
ncbi:MAG: D-aminoacyl-tRNA deacylase, partial [Candidatus Diapherotrites archaeon]|nr:D-aminoacyl-tRNA deacylase [Candidatus Diapherotrites archaeon]